MNMTKSAEKNLYLRTVGLGVMSGMRSMSAPWLLSYRATKEPRAFKGTWLGWLGYPQIRSLFTLMELGELAVDKTSLLPSRISPLPLVGRVQLGAFAGAAAFTEADKPALLGSIVAAIGAIASSFLFYYLRRSVARKTGLPDLPLALIEDATLAGIGLAVLRSYSPPRP